MINSKTYILSVDPGKATGVAWLTVKPDGPAEITYAYETTGSMNDTLKLWDEWLFDSRSPGELIVLCENWIPMQTAFATNPASAIEPMAWLKLLARQENIEMETPNPQQRLAITDDAIKQAGYWQKGGAGHKRSAVRHGLCWVLRQNHLPTTELLYPRTDRP